MPLSPDSSLRAASSTADVRFNRHVFSPLKRAQGRVEEGREPGLRTFGLSRGGSICRLALKARVFVFH